MLACYAFHFPPRTSHRRAFLVTLFPVPQVVENNVHVAGAVKSPGTFGYRPGMTVSELITYSGGLFRYADMEKAELTRVDITRDGPVTERVTVSLDKALAGFHLMIDRTRQTGIHALITF